MTSHSKRPVEELPDYPPIGLRCALAPKVTLGNSVNLVHLALGMSPLAVVLFHLVSLVTVMGMLPFVMQTQVTILFVIGYCVALFYCLEKKKKIMFFGQR